MSKHPRSTNVPPTKLPHARPPQPQRDSELETIDPSEDNPIDEPADAQRSSKSEPDGDGEEEVR